MPLQAELPAQSRDVQREVLAHRGRSRRGRRGAAGALARHPSGHPLRRRSRARARSARPRLADPGGAGSQDAERSRSPLRSLPTSSPPRLWQMPRSTPSPRVSTSRSPPRTRGWRSRYGTTGSAAQIRLAAPVSSASAIGLRRSAAHSRSRAIPVAGRRSPPPCQSGNNCARRTPTVSRVGVAGGCQTSTATAPAPAPGAASGSCPSRVLRGSRVWGSLRRRRIRPLRQRGGQGQVRTACCCRLRSGGGGRAHLGPGLAPPDDLVRVERDPDGCDEGERDERGHDEGDRARARRRRSRRSGVRGRPFARPAGGSRRTRGGRARGRRRGRAPGSCRGGRRRARGSPSWRRRRGRCRPPSAGGGR